MIVEIGNYLQGNTVFIGIVNGYGQIQVAHVHVHLLPLPIVEIGFQEIVPDSQYTLDYTEGHLKWQVLSVMVISYMASDSTATASS